MANGRNYGAPFGFMNNPMFQAGMFGLMGASPGQQMQHLGRAQALQQQQDIQQQRLDLMRQRLNQPDKPPDAIQQYQFAQKQGFPGTFMDFKTSLRKSGAPQTTINMPFEGAYAKKAGGILAERRNKIAEAASTAESDLARYDVIGEVIKDPNLYTGKFGGWVQGAKEALAAAGLDVAGVESGQLLNSLQSELTVGWANALPGALQVREMEMVQKIPPSILKLPETNRRLVELSKAQKQYEIDVNRAADEYIANKVEKGQPPQLDSGFYSVERKIKEKWRKRMKPLYNKLMSGKQEPRRSMTAGVPVVGQVYNGYRYKGGDPNDKNSYEAVR